MIGTLQKVEIPHAITIQVQISNKRCITPNHEVSDIFYSSALLHDLVQVFDREFHIDISHMLNTAVRH